MPTISLRVNGKSVSAEVEARTLLVELLRERLGLTGTHVGCDTTYCGACTVLVDNKPVRSCVYPVRNANGREVRTIEGLSKNGELHPLQKAFVEHDALQCGFCTPGMILTAYSLLRENPQPTREEIIQGMDDNFCRCGGYHRIIQAIEAAAQTMRKGGRR